MASTIRQEGTITGSPNQNVGANGGSHEADGPSRRVLMVLFHFPPLGGVAVPRNVCNAKYLPSFGWTPVVVAPRDCGGILDPDLLQLIPPRLAVYRAWCPEPRHLRRVLDPLRARLTMPKRRRSSSADMHGDTGIPGPRGSERHATPGPPPAPGWLWRFHRLMAFPDNQVGWLPFALFAALRAHRTRRFHVVYSTAAPTTVHLVAGIFKRLTGVPWVAEFRDPWLGNPITEALGGPRSWLHRSLQVKLERWIMRSADRIVFVSPSTAQLYRQRYPGAGEIVTITNGHDGTEASLRSAHAAEPGRYRIVWTGSLIRPDELETFLLALEAVVLRRPELIEHLKVAFYGEVSDSCRTLVNRFAREGPLASVLRLEGFMPRRVALQALADADAALVMLGSGPGLGQTIPAKLFDILGQNQQVLAVLPPGDARDILQELGWGVLAYPDVADIERAIERLLALPRPTRPADPAGKYDRSALAGRLADTFREVTEASQRARASQPGSLPSGHLE